MGLSEPLILLVISSFVSADSNDDNDNDVFQAGGTLQEEIQCYALPYGALGFASHILTYYTILCLASQRPPWAPWRKKLRHATFDYILAVVTLIVTTVVTIITIVHCRNRWQFITLASWKLSLSLTLGFLSIHAAALFKSDWDDSYRDKSVVLWWLVLYAIGLIGGVVGLFSLVAQTIQVNHNVGIVTAVFGSVIGSAVVFVLLIVYCTDWGDEKSGFIKGFLSGLVAMGIGALGIGVLGALYSDWILAAIADNMTGVPSSDNAALYYGYFAAKRLTMFSS